MFSSYKSYHCTVEIMERFLPHIGQFQKCSFEFSKYESFAAFMMPKHSCNGNFRPFWAFIDFLQMFKVGKFASRALFLIVFCQESAFAPRCRLYSFPNERFRDGEIELPLNEHSKCKNVGNKYENLQPRHFVIRSIINDTIRMVYSSQPSDMNFQMIIIPKGIYKKAGPMEPSLS